jgi:hypothetical protein
MEFLNDRLGFLEMSDIVEQCLAKMDYVKSPSHERLRQPIRNPYKGIEVVKVKN